MRDLTEHTSAEAELREICSALHLDRAVVRRFIADYLLLLNDRIRRIEDDLDSGRAEAAAVGLLSLASSSAMLHAARTAEAAEQLRSLQAHSDSADSSEILRSRWRLHEVAASDRGRLRQLLAAEE